MIAAVRRLSYGLRAAQNPAYRPVRQLFDFSADLRRCSSSTNQLGQTEPGWEKRQPFCLHSKARPQKVAATNAEADITKAFFR